MLYNIIGVADKILMKWKRFYWRNVLFYQLGYKLKGSKVYGRVMLLANNVTIGENVTIYPGVMLYGDGSIEIGNNVSIGNNTIIYASATGGVKIGDYTAIMEP